MCVCVCPSQARTAAGCLQLGKHTGIITYIRMIYGYCYMYKLIFIIIYKTIMSIFLVNKTIIFDKQRGLTEVFPQPVWSVSREWQPLSLDSCRFLDSRVLYMSACASFNCVNASLLLYKKNQTCRVHTYTDIYLGGAYFI
jgi:hypothetical protein